MTTSRWRLEEVDGVNFARCAAFDAIPGVAHAFSTRRAFGRSDFDLGPNAGDPDGSQARVASFCRAAGLRDARPALIRQVHGGVIVDADEPAGGTPDADGVFRVARGGVAGPIPAVSTADCVGVLFVDRRATAMAAIHAGWKGVAAGIGAGAVARFALAGVAPGSLIVALGPAILGCCYEVGAEVVAAMSAACGAPSSFVSNTGSGSLSVDLHAALRRQLVIAGVPADAIHAAPWCTYCHSDLFFSYRREGSAAGRLLAAIGPGHGP